MEKDLFGWKDVEVSILGNKVKTNSMEYIQGTISNKFEGNITIVVDELDSLLKNKIKVKKLSNFQRKKAWKNFCKTFNIKL